MGGTRTNEYPTAFNYQIQGCGPLPENITLDQWNKIVNQSAETLYLGKKGATPSGLPRSTCDTVLWWTSCTNVLNVGCWNYGDVQGVHYIGGHHKVPRWLTDIPKYADPEDPGYEQCGNPAFRMITEGSKHCSFWNEAYGFEDDEHISRCLNACGWITK